MVSSLNSETSTAPSLRRLTRSRLVDEVADHLRELIISGELESGTQLLQIDLADRLGVSRTPLREAFRVLERDGLIRVSNGNKTVEVALFTPADLVDMYQIREVLDGLAARLCARGKYSENLKSALLEEADAMDSAAESNDLALYGAHHAEFHVLMFLHSGNSRLQDEVPIVRISSQVQMIRFLRTRQDESVSDEFMQFVHRLLILGNGDHRSMLSCLETGDQKGAEESAREHMRRSADAMERYILED
jgi:GntR family transcriptional regulator of vanillate catabolism